MENNENLNHCHTGIGCLFNPCEEGHINNNPNHNFSSIKLLVDKNNEPINENDKCVNCGDDIKYLDNYLIYNCKIVKMIFVMNDEIIIS